MSSKVAVTEFSFQAVVRVEIRGRRLVEDRWIDKQGVERLTRYIRLVTDDAGSGDRMVFRDRDVSHDTDLYYPRGAVGALTLSIQAHEGFGCKGDIDIVAFVADGSTGHD